MKYRKQCFEVFQNFQKKLNLHLKFIFKNFHDVFSNDYFISANVNTK